MSIILVIYHAFSCFLSQSHLNLLQNFALKKLTYIICTLYYKLPGCVSRSKPYNSDKLFNIFLSIYLYQSPLFKCEQIYLQNIVLNDRNMYKFLKHSNFTLPIPLYVVGSFLPPTISAPHCYISSFRGP